MRLHLPILLLLALGACMPGDGDPPKNAGETDPIFRNSSAPIPATRGLAPGARAAAEGVVTVPTGAVDSGFAIGDGAAAIYVAPLGARKLTVGTRVRVSGTLEDRHGVLTLVPHALALQGAGPAILPRPLRTADVGEPNEAVVVRVEGRITGPVVDDRPYGWKIMIDDGSGPLQVFVPAHRRFNPAAYGVGRTLTAVGMSAQYDSTYEVIAAAPFELSP